jgi:hypothetical protein
MSVALGGRVVDAAKVQREPYESTSAGPNREDMHFNGSLDARGWLFPRVCCCCSDKLGADASSGVGRAVSATGMIILRFFF